MCQTRQFQVHNAYSGDEIKSIASGLAGARASTGVDQPALCSLDRQRCEHTGPVGARVDPDAVGTLLDLVSNRVPMSS